MPGQGEISDLCHLHYGKFPPDYRALHLLCRLLERGSAREVEGAVIRAGGFCCPRAVSPGAGARSKNIVAEATSRLKVWVASCPPQFEWVDHEPVG